MRKLLLPLAVSLPLVLGLAGCGGSDEAAGDDHGHGGNSEVAEGARTIAVEATSFEFSPATIEVEAGEDVAIELTAEDVEHDFVIDEVDAHVRAEGGESATGGFTAPDEPGELTFYCSVSGHRQAGMEGTLVVR